jgi:DNA-binding response OmpR family regulator
MLNPILSVTGDMQALVVDDDPQICRFVTDVLRADGWQVSTAETAARALIKEGKADEALEYFQRASTLREKTSATATK